MTDPVPPSRLWKRMTASQRLRAAQALWANEEGAAEQQSAAQLIAKQFKSRPKSVHALDGERKARYLASVPEVPDDLAAHLLVVYHLAEQRPMMGAFLDALGISHANGVIAGDPVAPEPARLASAVATVKGAYPADDVALYFDTLLWQDPGTWGGLRDAR